jgi:hypothetical protein
VWTKNYGFADMEARTRQEIKAGETLAVVEAMKNAKRAARLNHNEALP